MPASNHLPRVAGGPFLTNVLNNWLKQFPLAACWPCCSTLKIRKAMITLNPRMTYRFQTKGPLAATKGSPLGERQYWEMSTGTLTGSGISAKIAMPGGDWTQLTTDGFSRPDVRVQLMTDDGALILLRYTGLVEVNEAFTKAAENNAATNFGDHYMRMSMQFDTGNERYDWLNQHLFVAEGKLRGTNEVEYLIYQLD
jgi:hypothetical protein